MESLEAAVKQAFFTGYLQGYDFAIEVIDQCIKKETHANPQVVRVLNEAFTVLSKELKLARELIGPLDANP